MIISGDKEIIQDEGALVQAAAWQTQSKRYGILALNAEIRSLRRIILVEKWKKMLLRKVKAM